jgi:RHS repeat-associated protein
MREQTDGNPTGAVYWLHSDHLGSASLTTDASGGKFAELRYKPWGEVRWSSEVMPTDRRFTGVTTHAGLGLVTMGLREYLPTLGRWLSADTIVPGAGDPQAFNRFSYVKSSPLKYIDPTGHAEQCDEYTCGGSEDVLSSFETLDGRTGQITVKDLNPYARKLWSASTKKLPQHWPAIIGPLLIAMTASNPTPEMKLLMDWWFSAGDAERNFKDGEEATQNMMRSAGVVAAREKYLDFVKKSGGRVPTTELDYYYTFDAAEHFSRIGEFVGGDWATVYYGSYNVRIHVLDPNNPLTVQFEVTNATTWDSATRLGAKGYGTAGLIYFGPNHSDLSLEPPSRKSGKLEGKMVKK